MRAPHIDTNEHACSSTYLIRGSPSRQAIKLALPSQWMAGQDTEVDPIVVRWKNKALAALQWRR